MALKHHKKALQTPMATVMSATEIRNTMKMRMWVKPSLIHHLSLSRLRRHSKERHTRKGETRNSCWLGCRCTDNSASRLIRQLVRRGLYFLSPVKRCKRVIVMYSSKALISSAWSTIKNSWDSQSRRNHPLIFSE